MVCKAFSLSDMPDGSTVQQGQHLHFASCLGQLPSPAAVIEGCEGETEWWDGAMECCDGARDN